ncbi:eyes absent homolog 2 [Prunus yedoensis var. nudiflora]|uniref:protein-tyrosine-phosphatase n=1 Tax=Prunus yedoensis var. nudiflora TaxID=2094558 RepID=A0A314UWF2_PRUYE|nr:eyes absent homolog 2 [Prunus yedoensis var. nudiflora]
MHYASNLFSSIIKHSSIVAQESCSSCINVARVFLEECSAWHKKTSLVAADGIKSSASKYQHVNLLVTSGSLIPSLVKCLLFRLDNMITDENGPLLRNWGWMGEAAQAMRWPFVKIDVRPGGSHRFPGLTSRTLGFYFSVVYGSSDAEDEEE